MTAAAPRRYFWDVHVTAVRFLLAAVLGGTVAAGD